MNNVKERLEQERKEVQEKLDHIAQRLQERGDYGFGKGDPAVVQWEFNFALRERYQEHLEQVESALARLSEGTYGTCRECGQHIEEERLGALPFTSLCIECARHNH